MLGGAGTKTSLTTPMMNLSPGTSVFTTCVEVSRVVDTQPAETRFPAPKKIA
jgi:hypothetical protein